MDLERTHMIIEVTAGGSPGTLDPAYTRRWRISNDEWDIAGDHHELLVERNSLALGNASNLMLDPDVKWVRLEWIIR